MSRSGKFSVLVLVLLSSTAFALEGTGLRLSSSVDTVGRAAISKNNDYPTTFDVRGAEISLYAPADHLFDGSLSLAYHGFESTPMVELHEAYVGSTKLIPRSRFRFGQFFLGVGRLNQFHQHDWPFISAPKVHTEFFDQEGILDSGAEYSFLFPTPFFLEATVGVTKGFVYGHSHVRGNTPQIPTNYARLATFLPMPVEGGAQLGFSYLGHRGNEGTQRTMFGVDLTAKWKEVKTTQFLLQSEFWYRELAPVGSDITDSLGFYVYPEYHLGEGFFFGLRFDYFSILNLRDAIGIEVKRTDLNVVPTATWRPSEFVTVRMAYNLRPEFQGAPAAKTNHYIELQSIFILGSHPAHDF